MVLHGSKNLLASPAFAQEKVPQYAPRLQTFMGVVWATAEQKGLRNRKG